MLRPVLPGNWPGVRFTYRPDDRGTVYHVDVRTVSNHERPRATFDGRPLAIEAGGVRVPLLRDGQAHRVVFFGNTGGKERDPEQNHQSNL